MKIKEGYELRQVGDDWVVITIGDAVNDFNGMIKLNKTGAFIWQKLQNGIEMDVLVESVADEYSIDKTIAEQDVKAFLKGLEQTACFAD